MIATVTSYYFCELLQRHEDRLPLGHTTVGSSRGQTVEENSSFRGYAESTGC